tara:strand:- start:940 stop:1194 length:255 start_codon:yes stop_codon:yes gene_type:complete
MKWLVVVIFSGVLQNGTMETFVFTNPRFNTVEECIVYANNPPDIRNMVRRIYAEYNEIKDIHKVVCSTEKQIIEVLRLSVGEDT